MSQPAMMAQFSRSTSSLFEISMQRLMGFSFGIATQALFAFTVVGLFTFLRYGPIPGTQSWLLMDTLLALQFTIPHSLLLHPKTRNRLRSVIAAEFYGAFFCICTCVSLLLIFRYWKSTNSVIWDLHGTGATCMVAAFYFSWAWMLYSISLTGLGFQTGWTQWQYWYREKKLPRRDFKARSLYCLMRHPVYLGFLGLIWFTPTMTADHALLTSVWTIYIAIGSVLKDQRLLFYLGDSYRQYMQNVSGYPLMTAGPLAKSQVIGQDSRDLTSKSGKSACRISANPATEMP